MKEASVVLNAVQIEQKIERIAFEIMETTFETPLIYIGGISGNGFLFAERLVLKMQEITTQKIMLFEIKVNKDEPLEEAISLSIDDTDISESTVILVDDVINSGRTMMHAVRRLLQNQLKVLKVATMVNRTHRRFPVHADFVGVNIATTLQDNITVVFGQNECAYLD